MTDSIDLLNNEIAKEEALLARETKQLQEMEKNAKRAEAERKRQMKNVYWLTTATFMRTSTN
jgi:kinetochore protein Fta7